MISDRKLYLNADKTRAVEEDDPEASFILAGEGGVIPPEYRNLPGIRKDEDTEAKAVQNAPENKAVKSPSDSTKAKA